MEGRAKAITAVIGMLTAIVVLMGSLTDQGWLPTFIKRPVQSAIPGTQPNEHPQATQTTLSSNGNAHSGSKNSGTADGSKKNPGGNGSNGAAYGPDTCVQGFVWREAVAGDHVCVTPEIREQASGDNTLADSRRSPTGGDYGPDTCLEGYVWREAVPDDHTCVTPETREQTRQDNAVADSRRVHQ